MRVVFDVHRASSYLFVIYRRGGESSLAKIIRIYESLYALSDGPEALPITGAHGRANWVWSLLSRSSIKGSFSPSSITYARLLRVCALYFLSLCTQSSSRCVWLPHGEFCCVHVSLWTAQSLKSTLTSPARLSGDVCDFIILTHRACLQILSLVVAHTQSLGLASTASVCVCVWAPIFVSASRRFSAWECWCFG